jgi:hypothetical protein
MSPSSNRRAHISRNPPPFRRARRRRHASHCRRAREKIRPTSSSESTNSTSNATAHALELLIPVWASRASANVTRDVEFYQRLLGAQLTYI